MDHQEVPGADAGGLVSWKAVIRHSQGLKLSPRGVDLARTIQKGISASETAVIASLSTYLEKYFRQERRALLLQMDVPRKA